jgi:CBS domain-containing protein
MLVKELMSSSVCFVKEDASLLDIAALMKKHDVGLIPVCDNKGCLLGVITDRDIVLKLAENNPSINMESKAAPVAETIMNKSPVTIASDLNIHDAACVFSQHRLRRLPVVENHRLVGILSISDLAKRKLFLAEVGDILGEIAKKN